MLSSWKNNWENLTAYFDYDEHIHRLIYTINPVEGFHCQVRKVTKTKGVFPNDMVLLKLIYLATKNIAKKWMPPSNWVLTSQQLHIKFGERKPLSLQYPTLKHKERNRDRNNQGLINTDSRCPCLFPTRFQKSIWELKTKK